MTLTQVAYPSAPTITPLRSTLLDVATVTDGIKWHDGRDLYDSYNCMEFLAEAEFCDVNDKDFDQGTTWQNGFRFAVYGGVTCKAVGLSQAEMKSQAERVFNAKESLGVERGFMKTRFIEGETLAGETDPQWEVPTDLTPAGGAVSASVGVGLLESHAASIYAGQATLHMPRLIATLMAQNGAIEWDGDILHSALGSKIAAGAGYDLPNLGPDGNAPAEDERWVYATGEVSVMRSGVISIQAMDRSTNDVLLLVERAYIGSVDCYAAAVRVKVE